MRLAIASGVARVVVAVLWGPSFSNDSGRYTQLGGGGVDIDWLGKDANPAPLTQLVWHPPHDLAVALQAAASAVARQLTLSSAAQGSSIAAIPATAGWHSAS